MEFFTKIGNWFSNKWQTVKSKAAELGGKIKNTIGSKTWWKNNWDKVIIVGGLSLLTATGLAIATVYLLPILAPIVGGVLAAAILGFASGPVIWLLNGIKNKIFHGHFNLTLSGLIGTTMLSGLFGTILSFIPFGDSLTGGIVEEVLEISAIGIFKEIGTNFISQLWDSLKSIIFPHGIPTWLLEPSNETNEFELLELHSNTSEFLASNLANDTQQISESTAEIISAMRADIAKLDQIKVRLDEFEPKGEVPHTELFSSYLMHTQFLPHESDENQLLSAQPKRCVIL